MKETQYQTNLCKAIKKVGGFPHKNVQMGAQTAGMPDITAVFGVARVAFIEMKVDHTCVPASPERAWNMLTRIQKETLKKLTALGQYVYVMVVHEKVREIEVWRLSLTDDGHIVIYSRYSRLISDTGYEHVAYMMKGEADMDTFDPEYEVD